MTDQISDMAVVIPCHAGDIQAIVPFFDWCKTLKPGIAAPWFLYAEQTVLSLFDNKLDKQLTWRPSRWSRITFPGKSVPPFWPHMPNRMFAHLPKVRALPAWYLWLELDSVPLRKGWLRTIYESFDRKADYSAFPKLGRSIPHYSGTGVYRKESFIGFEASKAPLKPSGRGWHGRVPFDVAVHRLKYKAAPLDCIVCWTRGRSDKHKPRWRRFIGTKRVLFHGYRLRPGEKLPKVLC